MFEAIRACVFWKRQEGEIKEVFIPVFRDRRYTTSQSTNFIVRMNNCKKTNDGDKAEIRKIMTWYSEIRRMMHFVAQILMN